MQQHTVNDRGLHSTDCTLRRGAEPRDAGPVFFELPDDPFDEHAGFGGFAGLPVAGALCTVELHSDGNSLSRHGTGRIEVDRDKWYLRLQLPTDCLAELWVRDLTPHNVLAWSDGSKNWVPLLAVPELREAIRSAQDKKTRALLRPSEPPGGEHEPLPLPRGVVAGAGTRADQVMRSWSMPLPARKPPSLVPPAATGSTVPAPCPPSTMPPPATSGTRGSTTMPPPPMALIPRPGRLPVFGDQAGNATADATGVEGASLSRTVGDKDGTLVPPSLATMPAPPPAGKLFGLVNLERALWLAAGISVATASFLVLQGRGASKSEMAGGRSPKSAIAAGAAPVVSGGSCVAPRDGSSSAVASVEELPLVGKNGKPLAASRSLSDVKTEAVSAGPAKLGPSSTSRGVRTPAPTQAAGVASPTLSVAAGAFDPAVARRVLSSAAARARSCADGAMSGSVLVTFAPSGFVQSASLASIQGDSVRKGCVLRAFQEARVSPFTGAPVSVKKSF